jgi:hypothetical protein
MELKEEWDIGDTVICDTCGVDFTNAPESQEKGGMLFGSNGVCPRCAPRMEKDAIKYGEQGYIKARAGADETFKDFIVRIRNGNNKVKFYA